MSLEELTISGSVVRPGEADWDAARMAWNLAADQHPEAVVLVESADDIAKTVRFAAEHGCRSPRRAPATAPSRSARSRTRCSSRPSGCAVSRSTARRRRRAWKPDLFWAMRGGGGCYAIVTALHVALLPIPELYAGITILPAELGADAIRAYRDWTESVPEEVTSIVRFLRPPPLPDVPEPLRDRPLITIDAAFIGSQAEGEALIAPLREIGEPIMDTFAQIPAEALSKIHMDPEQPVPGLGHHALIKQLPDEAIDAFVGAVGPEAGSPLLLAELRHIGGALGRESENAGALAKLDADYLMFGIGLPMTPELGQAIDRSLDQLEQTMAPWSADGGYFNFAERECGVDTILPAAVCDHLGEVKHRWDPDGLIRSNHAVAVAPA